MMMACVTKLCGQISLLLHMIDMLERWEAPPPQTAQTGNPVCRAGGP